MSALLTSTGRVREWLEGARRRRWGSGRSAASRSSARSPAVVASDGYEVNATFPWDRRPFTPRRRRRPSADFAGCSTTCSRVLADVDRFEAAHGPLTARATAGRVVGRRGAPPPRQRDGLVRRPRRRRDLRRPAGRRGRADRARRRDGVGPRAASRRSPPPTRPRGHRRARGDVDAGEDRPPPRLPRVRAPLGPRPPPRARRRHAATGSRSASTAGRTRRRWRPCCDPWAGTARPGRRRCSRSAIEGTPEFAAAWDGDRLVGTARSLSDGALQALIATVVVHPRYQGLGVGERMMHALIDDRDGVRFALAAAPGMDAWYRKLGFIPDARAMMRPRGRI